MEHNWLNFKVTEFSCFRIITDHGKESRFPFLDERVVQFLSGLPINEKVNHMFCIILMP